MSDTDAGLDGPDETTPEAAEAAEVTAVAVAVEDETTDDTADDAGDGEDGGEGGEAPARRTRLQELELEGEIAADYLEGLLDIIDMDGDLDLDVEGDRAVVAIIGERLDKLVGPGGATLDALQELTRLAVLQGTGERSRLMLDIAGHRARRRVELTALGTAAAERVLASGAEEKLAPMSPFERKVVHDAVAAVEGVHSESEGEEPQRRVVVLPD